MNPKQEADRIFPTLLARTEALQKEHGRPVIIPLSTYQTDNDLAVLRPEDKGAWTASFHHAVMNLLAEKLRAKGFNVVLRSLNAATYLRWLAETNQKNTPANRAQFISLQV